VVWVFFGVIYSHAIVSASALPFAIIALNKAGGHVATMGSLRAVADDFPSLVVEIVPPATVAAVVARLVNWRASRLYMSR
jgi:short-subunit dehydrogenase involved in D-alanine esterification of teichoic acids